MRKKCGGTDRKRLGELKISGLLWEEDYEKPMKTGQKQGEIQLCCFS
jgi:hypothetical protein